VTSRRELTVTVLLCAVGGGLALWATTRPWAVLVTDRPAPLPALRETVSGGAAAPIAAALALVGLAGAAALLAARGVLRAGVGALLLLSGAGIVWGGVGVLARGVPGAATATEVDLAAAWPVLCVAGGVLVAAAGLVSTVRGRRWSALGRRYEAPGVPARPEPTRSEPTRSEPTRSEPAPAPEQPPSGMWDALDRGEDPTSR
jgi:uncharacterized membrane protein (TIGR02234 family)